MRVFLLAILFISACQCDADVYDMEPDGGLSQPYCAQECVTTSDCPGGQHCSWHPLDPKGICFKNLDKQSDPQ